jgi:hypothetical protein
VQDEPVDADVRYAVSVGCAEIGGQNGAIVIKRPNVETSKRPNEGTA